MECTHDWVGRGLASGRYEILAQLGYTSEQIEELCKDCVLSWSPTEGHRKVRSPWQPQAPAAAAEKK